MRTHVTRSSIVLFAIALFAFTPAFAQAPAAPGPLMELTMARAVELALEANLGLKSDRMELDNAAYGIAIARSAFLPQLNSGLSRNSRKTVPSDFTQGVRDITSQNLQFGTGLSQTLPWLGTRYSANWNSSRNTQVNSTPLFNPALGSSFGFSVTQPLLRGFRSDQARAGLEASERRRAIADIELQAQIVRLETRVQNAYLDLISATQALRVAEQNMEIRQSSLANARARVAVGAAAPIDLISAETEVASNQEQVLLAQADIQTREDALRTLILDPARPDFWRVHIVATDTIQVTQRTIDVDAAVKNALDNRLDLSVAKRNRDIQDLNLRVSRDATKPAVDVRFDYSGTGSGGTRLTYEGEFPDVIITDRVVRSFGSLLGDTFGNTYPNWTASVNVAYPLGRSAAEANYAQQEVARRQTDIALRELVMLITQQVRDAARRVENTYQRVLVTRTALNASERQYEAEQRRQSAGLSTTLELQVRQQGLASARTAELGAMIIYQRALIEFERVQKAQ